jgi:hypothetical protein
MTFVVVLISLHDPKGKVVKSCDCREKAEEERKKLDETTPPSQLSFFYIKETATVKE